jgi:hypothetical protein
VCHQLDLQQPPDFFDSDLRHHRVRDPVAAGEAQEIYERLCDIAV